MPQPDKTPSGNASRQRELTALLRHLPLGDPPRDLTAAVLARLETRRPWSLWRRLSCWLRTPWVITIRPLPMLSTAAAVLFLVVGGYIAYMAPQDPVARQKGGSLVPVVFDLAYPNASRVAVIGTFNGWRPEGYEMHAQGGTDRWVIRIKVPAGAYEYAFLIDGREVVADPGAAFYKRDGFGSRNAVIYAGFNEQEVY